MFLVIGTLVAHPCMCLTGCRLEAEVIEEIVNTILTRLRPKLLHVDKNLVGMDDRLEEIIPEMIDPSSNDVRMIGIYGLGGIGKTTIAKVVYNKISFHFMIASFIANVREDAKSRGLLHLQKQLLRDILSRKNLMINVDEGTQMIKEKLSLQEIIGLATEIS